MAALGRWWREVWSGLSFNSSRVESASGRAVPKRSQNKGMLSSLQLVIGASMDKEYWIWGTKLFEGIFSLSTPDKGESSKTSTRSFYAGLEISAPFTVFSLTPIFFLDLFQLLWPVTMGRLNVVNKTIITNDVCLLRNVYKCQYCTSHILGIVSTFVSSQWYCVQFTWGTSRGCIGLRWLLQKVI